MSDTSVLHPAAVKIDCRDVSYTGVTLKIFLRRDPGSLFYPSRILNLGSPDLGSRIQQLKQKQEGKIFVLNFFVANNLTKFKIILFSNRYPARERKKLLAC